VLLLINNSAALGPLSWLAAPAIKAAALLFPPNPNQLLPPNKNKKRSKMINQVPIPGFVAIAVVPSICF
jgi:hypothetical protein